MKFQSEWFFVVCSRRLLPHAMPFSINGNQFCIDFSASKQNFNSNRVNNLHVSVPLDLLASFRPFDSFRKQKRCSNYLRKSMSFCRARKKANEHNWNKKYSNNFKWTFQIFNWSGQQPKETTFPFWSRWPPAITFKPNVN